MSNKDSNARFMPFEADWHAARMEWMYCFTGICTQKIRKRVGAECMFESGKHKLGLSRIIPKLAETTGAMIGIGILILSMEKRKR